MNLNEYQQKAMETAIYPGRGNNIIYPTLKLCGEAGEVSEQVGKMMRDDDNKLTIDRQKAIIMELGDVLWYIAALADELNTPLEEIAKLNLGKLKSRQERGVLKGNGSDR